MHLHDQWISPPDQHNEEEDIHEAYNDISGKIMRRISAGAVTGCVDSRAEQWAAPESRLAETTLPEKTMPKNHVHDLLHQELKQDANPRFNLATFNSTYMEPEVTKLIAESLPKNIVDPRAYPVTADIEQRCIRILANMYNLPESDDSLVVGTSTVGSSEAIMLAVLAMRTRWAERREREPEGKETSTSDSRPNLIISSAAQVCWKKAARYFDVDLQYVPCSNERFVLDPAQAVGLVNSGTIGICCILGTTYTGEYEDVKGVNDLLVQRGLDVPIHVDAASGGFVAPFIVPEWEWDFRLDKVVSINVSGHKYGLVYPGIGWALWRSPEYLPEDLVFQLSYLGASQDSITLNFSKGSSHVIAQYYQFVRLGKAGYQKVIGAIMDVAAHLADALSDTGFTILSKAAGFEGVPVVAFRLNPAQRYGFDEFDVARELENRGWLVPAYRMADGAHSIHLLRVVCRFDFTEGLCEKFVQDVGSAMAELERRDAEKNTGGDIL